MNKKRSILNHCIKYAIARIDGHVWLKDSCGEPVLFNDLEDAFSEYSEDYKIFAISVDIRVAPLNEQKKTQKEVRNMISYMQND